MADQIEIIVSGQQIFVDVVSPNAQPLIEIITENIVQQVNYDIYQGIAGEDLDSGRLVYVSGGKCYLYDADDENLANEAIGLTQDSALEDEDVTVQLNGLFTKNGFGLTGGAIYYASVDGLISTSANRLVFTLIGVSLGSNSINLNIRQSIVTSN